MDYSRVTPRARTGTTGINDERDLTADKSIIFDIPDRVAAVSIQVAIPADSTATYKIETTCNRPETIGADGSGGYWFNIYGDGAILDGSGVIMLANSVTGVRVTCLTGEINVAICG